MPSPQLQPPTVARIRPIRRPGDRCAVQIIPAAARRPWHGLGGRTGAVLGVGVGARAGGRNLVGPGASRRCTPASSRGRSRG